MNSKDQNLDLTRTKRIHFYPFSFAGVVNLWYFVNILYSVWRFNKCCAKSVFRQIFLGYANEEMYNMKYDPSVPRNRANKGASPRCLAEVSKFI